MAPDTEAAPMRSVVSLVAAGGRKYLTAAERARFIAAARRAPRPTVQTFALSLAHTGCRISEALGLRAVDVDLEALAIRFRTLKRRVEVWREVPVPEDMAALRNLRKTARRRLAPGSLAVRFLLRRGPFHAALSPRGRGQGRVRALLSTG